MRFDPISEMLNMKRSEDWFPDKLAGFVADFNITGYSWGSPCGYSASYFLRLLREGTRARARWINRRDECSCDLDDYRDLLFDHGILWRTGERKIICTGMPYYSDIDILRAFTKMKERFEYPDTIRLHIMSEKYKYRPNGSTMLMIRDEAHM